MSLGEMVCSGFNGGVVWLGGVDGGQVFNIAETRKVERPHRK